MSSDTDAATTPRGNGTSNGLFGDRAMAAYAGWVFRWRWLIIVTTLVAAVAAASGARFLTFSNDYRIFFGDDNPQLRAYEELQNVYTKDDTVLLVIKPDQGDLFTVEALSAIRALTVASWQTPFATRVDSLANFQHSFAEGDDLTVRDLVPRDQTLTPELIADIRAVALAEPLLVDRVISPDGTTTAVAITLTFPQKKHGRAAPGDGVHARPGRQVPH